MIQILMVEDDIEISQLLVKFLKTYGMDVNAVSTPTAGMNALEMDQYDLIILDLTLPEMDGLELCKKLRDRTNIPIIISSARSDTMDKIMGLEYGADDYLPKPYEPRELVARIQSVMRRYRPSQSTNCKDFQLDESKMQITFHEKPLDLTTAEYEMLRLMILNQGTVLSRDFMANNCDSISWESGDRTIDVIISRLRHKIEKNSKAPEYIHSVRGVGYKFTC